MATLLISHPSFLQHDTGPYHPERADRLRAILAALDDPAFAEQPRLEAPIASLSDVVRVHPEDYVEAILGIQPSPGELVQVDGDTVMSAGSAEAVARAAGAAIIGVDAVMTGQVRTAFAAVRPPGHHASPDTPGGFCLFNSAAIGARHAQARHGAERVAIVDFDVHHGNGTQEIFWADESVLFCSTHQAPFYPGTGGRNETGAHDNIVNAPLFAGSTGDAFREALDDRILPRLQAFAPDLILISAGFDAHERDPLGGLRLRETDFGDATKRLMEIADRRCGGRIVSMLEGGYDVDALSRCVSAHVLALIGA